MIELLEDEDGAPYPEDVQRAFMIRLADVWDEGFTKCGRLILGFDHEPWPPFPNPYRAMIESGECEPGETQREHDLHDPSVTGGLT